jgi:transposase
MTPTVLSADLVEQAVGDSTSEAEAVRLRRQVEELEQQLRDARQQAGYWKALHARAVEKIQRLTAELEKAQAEIRKLKQDLFGRTSERSERQPRCPPVDHDPAAEKRKRGGQPGHPGHGRRDYSHLPLRGEFVELAKEKCRCPHCGKPYLPMADTEDSQQIEIEVRAYRRLIHRRRYRRSCSCPGPQTVTAPAPPKLIAKACYGTSVWVEVLLDKFASHRPTARLLDAWEHDGLSLSSATVTSGLRRIEPLLRPVWEALLHKTAEGDLHQADETGWPVFPLETTTKKAKQWLWGFSTDQAVAFHIDPRHNHQVPEEHFASSPPGVLVVDRAKIYQAMKQVKAGILKLAFCWAHVRRDFLRAARGWPKLKPWAVEWLRLGR